MAVRVAAHLPRLVVLGVVFLLAGATLTYGAAKRLSAPVQKPQATASAPTVVVPDVTGQAFVFAKGALEDAGFAWQVVGSVHGFAANTVVSQSPAPGTRLIDTGAPRITLGLKRNASYPQAGQAQDVSPYRSTAVQPAALASALGPAHPATTTPATTTTA